MTIKQVENCFYMSIYAGSFPTYTIWLINSIIASYLVQEVINMQPDYTISELVQRYKKENDKDSLMSVVNKMKPLINKYARALHYLEYEDMQQELSIALIESVNKLEEYENDGKVIRYIVNGVKHRFFELYRKQSVKKTEQNCDIQMLDTRLSVSEKFCDIEFGVDILLMRVLKNTKMKRRIAEYILFDEASDTEIAEKMNISRQYVNRCKKEIFSELLKY